ncbi:hypothetical protein TNCV_1724661 [Trichonephila clavipes]|nr:hypothetical protein TNCV_1724661 [Trichonephila clavipes]
MNKQRSKQLLRMKLHVIMRRTAAKFVPERLSVELKGLILAVAQEYWTPSMLILALCDFRLFLKSKIPLKGFQFHNRDEMRQNVKALNTIRKEPFQNSF